MHLLVSKRLQQKFFFHPKSTALPPLPSPISPITTFRSSPPFPRSFFRSNVPLTQRLPPIPHTNPPKAGRPPPARNSPTTKQLPGRSTCRRRSRRQQTGQQWRARLFIVPLANTNLRAASTRALSLCLPPLSSPSLDASSMRGKDNNTGAEARNEEERTGGGEE